mgnify:CR=1 FL=1
MGAPFGAKDEMTTAPLMVTVRNARGRRMLDAAIEAGRVEVLQRGGHGGRELPSEGDRRLITMKTVQVHSKYSHSHSKCVAIRHWITYHLPLTTHYSLLTTAGPRGSAGGFARGA